jgi:hypothetical protein
MDDQPLAPPEIVGYVQTGERMLWAGRPDVSKFLCREDTPKALFLVLGAWFCFIFGVSGLLVLGAGIGLPCILVVVQSPFRRRRRGRATSYAITSSRVLALVPRRREHVLQSIELVDHPPVAAAPRGSQGYGTLVVGERPRRARQPLVASGDPGMLGNTNSRTTTLGFRFGMCLISPRSRRSLGKQYKRRRAESSPTSQHSTHTSEPSGAAPGSHGCTSPAARYTEASWSPCRSW